MDVFIQYAIAASQFAMDDAKLAITEANAPHVGVFVGSGIGGFTSIEREHEALLAGGPRKISPFFIPASIINLAAGQVSIRFGAKGPEPGDVHRVLGVGACGGGVVRDHPARRRRRDDCRRIGGGDYADERRRVCRDARDVDAQRRARQSEPPVRQGSRRVHHRRGCGRHHSRRARVGHRTRRENLRRDRRLRHVRRRVSHHGAHRGWQRSSARHGHGHQEGPHRAAAGRLHQRARHLDAAQRSHRDARDQESVRRARLQDGDLVDEIDDRTSARRRRRPRGRHHCAGCLPSDGPTHHQPRQPRSGLRPRLRARQVPAREDGVRAVQLVRLRRHERGLAVSRSTSNARSQAVRLFSASVARELCV